MSSRKSQQPVYTTSNGCPVHNPTAYQRVGPNGPLLLQDFHLVDLLAHFDRERIPERVVHAKGAGAYGEVCAQCFCSCSSMPGFPSRRLKF